MKDHPFEEELFSRKEKKMQKKRASAQDRSKFKKTDRPKQEAKVAQRTERLQAKRELKQGRVIALSPETIWVDVEGTFFSCALRGAMKKEKTKVKNLVVVGDIVWIEELQGTEAALTYVEERYSLLARQEHLHRKQQQIIAANIDQVLITSAAVTPLLKPSLIDRYIIATRKGNMEPVVVVNKMDLLQKEEDRSFIETVLAVYKALSIPLFCVSASTGEGMKELEERMQGRTSVFAGQSGVGKSSLINCITGLALPIGEMVTKTQKGSHTTTSARLVPLSRGGWCIDTPGIRSFGIWDLTLQDLKDYFPEISLHAQECKFPNCSHTHEPHCAVHEALEKGDLSPLRFDSYLKLYANMEN